MTRLNAIDARSKRYSLIDETVNTRQPVVITGKRGNAVLVAEEDWNAITETLHLLSVPGMRGNRPPSPGSVSHSSTAATAARAAAMGTMERENSAFTRMG